MDPTACLNEITAALEAEGASDETRDRAEDLLHWLDGGGFMPTIRRRDLTALLACVIMARTGQSVGKPRYTD